MLYPALARRLPGDDPLAALSRTHQEIFRLANRLERRLETAMADGAEPTDRGEIRRLLYALHSLLELHFAQEAELFFQVGDGPSSRGA